MYVQLYDKQLYNFIKLMGRMKEQQQESEEESSQQNEDRNQGRKPKIQRLDQIINLRRVIINVSMTQYPVVTEVAQSLGWKVQYNNQKGDWDVFWTDFAIEPEVLIKMHLFQKINHYPGIHMIARKNLLGLNLMALRNKFPDQYNFFPLTWMLPLQYAEFRAYFESKPKGKARTYIAKPQAQCQGRGIFLTRKIEDLQNGKHYVVQRYLARPYLLQGLKFDLRIYVLLCSANPLRLYIYNQGLARLATEAYIQPTTSNLQKQYIHLTNYAINKHNPKFVFNKNSNNMGIGHKRSITSVFHQLQQKGVDIGLLKQKINDVAIKTIISGLPLMSHQYRCSQPEDYSGNMCFHILGLDIMLDHQAQPILLEVNHTPSFTTDTPLDHKIKFNLIKDTLKLMNVNIKTKQQLFNKARQLNNDRLVTGKRQIYEGKEREQAIRLAHQQRDQYQNRHLGGFSKIFPIQNQQKMKKYNQMIDTSNKIYLQQNSSIRMKMMEKQEKKFANQNFRKPTKMHFEKQKRGETQVSYNREFQTNKSNPIDKIIRNTINSCNRSFYRTKEIVSADKNELLTKSQHKMDAQSKQQYLVVDNELEDKTRINHPNSIIKIRKYEPQKLLSVQKNIVTQNISKGETKVTSLSKNNQKIITETPSILTKKSPLVNDSAIKNLSKVHNATQQYKDFFPNIVQSYMINSNLHTLSKRQGPIFSFIKHQNTIKSSSRKGKIYQQITNDMRNLIDRKNNFVMPRLASNQNNRHLREGGLQRIHQYRKDGMGEEDY